MLDNKIDVQGVQGVQGISTCARARKIFSEVETIKLSRTEKKACTPCTPCTFLYISSIYRDIKACTCPAHPAHGMNIVSPGGSK